MLYVRRTWPNNIHIIAITKSLEPLSTQISINCVHNAYVCVCIVVVGHELTI